MKVEVDVDWLSVIDGWVGALAQVCECTLDSFDLSFVYDGSAVPKQG